jgi:hypothetical protein
MSDADAIRAETLAVVQAYQTLLMQKRWKAWGELWAEDAVMEFPYAPAGAKGRYVGREEIVRYTESGVARMEIKGVAALRAHPMLDPRALVAELEIEGRIPATGRPYNQRYVTFFEIENGRIQRYREYWSPLISMEAYGGYDAYMAAVYHGHSD